MSKALRFTFVAALFMALSPFALAQSAERQTNPYTELKAAPSDVADRGGIVGDGSFETGSPNASWNESSTNFGTPLCTTTFCGFGGGTGPNTGDWWAWFGGINAVETGTVSQDVTIPSGTADLSFFLEIPVANNPGFLNVSLDGVNVFSVTEVDSAAYATYTEVTVNIDAFADGGVHTLLFESTVQPGDGVTNFFVDDVEITAGMTGGPVTINVAPDMQSVPRGGDAMFTYDVTNNTANMVSGVAFYEVFLNGSRVVGPVQVRSGSIAANGSTPTLALSVRVPNSAPLATYQFALSAGPSNGNAIDTDVVDVTVTAAARPIASTTTEWTLVDATPWPTLEAAATATAEIGAFPNPFALETTLSYTLEEATDVRLAVYDVLGREVAVLADGQVDAGTHTATFEARDLAAGTYVYRLVAGTQVQTGQITLIK